MIPRCSTSLGSVQRLHIETNRCAWDAQGRGVVITFISCDFRLGGLSRVLGVDGRSDKRTEPKHVPLQPIPVDVVNDEASTISVLMYDPLFKQNWEPRQLDVRRALCSRLVGILTRDIQMFDSRYQWSRALFRKIIAIK